VVAQIAGEVTVDHRHEIGALVVVDRGLAGSPW
jgi:UDP-3-O-[3-hydroxymyristoyl] glucosamine N-acyltransferase